MTKIQFEEVTKWQRENFTKVVAIHMVNKLMEEVCELHEGVVDPSSKRKDVMMEFADCFIVLYGAASMYGMTYDGICNVIHEKMEINKKRKWQKPIDDGIISHVKEKTN